MPAAEIIDLMVESFLSGESPSAIAHSLSMASIPPHGTRWDSSQVKQILSHSGSGEEGTRLAALIDKATYAIIQVRLQEDHTPPSNCGVKSRRPYTPPSARRSVAPARQSLGSDHRM
jgi:hypothetical protein